MEIRTTIRRLLVAVVAAGLLTSLVVAFAVPATAAEETGVRLDPSTDRVEVGETTTVGIVVTDAKDGVGAYNMTVSLDESASITNASIGGNAGLQDVHLADDGSSVRLVAALANTSNAKTVRIAMVTVEGETAGESTLDVQVNELADEQGRSYKIASTEGASLPVSDPADETVSSTDNANGDENHATPTTSDTTDRVDDDDDRPTTADNSSDETDDRSTTTPDDSDDSSVVAGVVVSMGAVVALLALFAFIALGVIAKTRYS